MIQVNELDRAKLVENVDTDTHVIIVRTKENVIIAFRGTVSSKNVRTDLAVRHRSHDGFSG